MDRAGQGVKEAFCAGGEKVQRKMKSGSGKKWKSVVESAKERRLQAIGSTLAHASPGRSPAFSTVKCWLGAKAGGFGAISSGLER